jgi:hypothetical protein
MAALFSKRVELFQPGNVHFLATPADKVQGRWIQGSNCKVFERGFIDLQAPAAPQIFGSPFRNEVEDIQQGPMLDVDHILDCVALGVREVLDIG